MRLFTRDSLERMGVTTRSIQSERGPRVKLHRNAKTTPIMRALIVQRIRQEQWPPAQAAAAAGISVRTTYKWLRRNRLGGRPALEDASSRPHRQPRRTLRRRPSRPLSRRATSDKRLGRSPRLHVPRSTVAAILVRAGLNRLAHLTPRGPVIRYERTRPGELAPSRYQAAGADPSRRASHSRRSWTKSQGAGYEDAHVAVDDYSRVAYVEVLPDQRGGPPRHSSVGPCAGLLVAA